jgi:carboxylesterase
MLVMTSREDHIVEAANSERLMAGVSSTDKQQIWLEDSYHVATLDNDLPLIIEKSLAFTHSHSPATSP